MVDMQCREGESITQFTMRRVIAEATAEKDAEIEKLRATVTAMTKWLEENQEDVFRRGMWEAISPQTVPAEDPQPATDTGSDTPETPVEMESGKGMENSDTVISEVPAEVLRFLAPEEQQTMRKALRRTVKFID